MRWLGAFVALALAALVSIAHAQEGGGGPAGTYFELDTLNAGLPPAPDGVDRTTPQGAVESLLDLVDARSDAAAHLLNLNGLDEAEQAERGPALAAQLKFVLEQQSILSWRTLLERPDALDAQQSSNAAMAGEPRRSILIGVIGLGDREAAIRLSRVLPANGDPVWVFSDRTVDRIPALYAEYGPSRMELALPPALRAETILGLKTWEVIGLPAILLAAWFAGHVTYHISGKLARARQSYWSRVAYRALRWPLIIVVTTTVVLAGALEIFTVSGPVASVLTPLTLIGYTAAVLIFALQVIDTALDRIVTFDDEKLSDPDNSRIRNLATTIAAGRRLLIVIALLIGSGVVLASANVFRSLGFSLLASAGALTLILGFAARTVLGNIMASLQIAMNRSARIGDQLVYNGTFCTVERIHFTFVQLKTWNGQRKVVPVSDFVSEEFDNFSMGDGASVRFSVLTLAQEADVDAMRERFFSIAEDDDRVSPKDECNVVVVGQDAFGKQVRFEAPIPRQNDGWPAECAIREQLLVAALELERERGTPFLPKGGLDDMPA